MMILVIIPIVNNNNFKQEEKMEQTDRMTNPLLARAIDNARKYPTHNNAIMSAGYNDGGGYGDGYGDSGYGDSSYGEGPAG